MWPKSSIFAFIQFRRFLDDVRVLSENYEKHVSDVRLLTFLLKTFSL